MANTQIPSGGSHSDADFLTRFRFWLIQLLAGKSVVILNAGIRKTEEDAVRFKNIEGLLASGNWFEAGLLITPECRE